MRTIPVPSASQLTDPLAPNEKLPLPLEEGEGRGSASALLLRGSVPPQPPTFASTEEKHCTRTSSALNVREPSKRDRDANEGGPPSLSMLSGRGPAPELAQRARRGAAQDRAIADKDSKTISALDEAVQLWNSMWLADAIHDQTIADNVAAAQARCAPLLAELRDRLRRWQ